ncbi:MAG: hypothetical protein JWP38_306 [Herbaspirillum sp.]|jgi:hypothetical protein|nr:hypothetical protein [Herbaspirillum sp.]
MPICSDVAAKLKRALNAAQAGETAGALLVALNKDGEWTASLAANFKLSTLGNPGNPIQ